MTKPTEQKSKLSAAKQALLEKKLRGRLGSGSTGGVIPKKPAGAAPLSFSQQRLWFLKQLDNDNFSYNIPTALHLRGELDISVLTQAVNEVIRRHEILRTTFEIYDGQATQKIAPELRIDIAIQNLSQLPEANRAAEIICRARQDGAHTFDLSKGPLLRVNLLSLGAQEYVLLFTLHHIIFDGWSAAILVEEFATFYRALLENRSATLPSLPLQYADFAYWQRQWLQGERLEKHLAYWRKQLEGVPALLELPTDHPRPSLQSGRGGLYPFHVPKDVVVRLHALSRQQGVTLFVTLLSAFNVLLHRYSGQNDFCVGSAVANRSHPELEALIGLFANMLVLRADLSGNPRFTEFLSRMHAVSLGAQQHQDLPFEKLVEELKPPRDRSYTPYFQIIFLLHNMPAGKWDMPGLAIRNMQLDFGSAKSDLDLHIIENDEGLAAEFEYSTDLFENATIKRMAEHFQTLLASIVEQPEVRVDDLPLMTRPEYRQLMAWSRAEPAQQPCNGLLHERFEAHAQKQPERPAIVCGAQQLSYGELNQRAELLANQLRARGVGTEVRVGLCAERSVDAIVGILAILKANGVYVPLDPAAPPERINEFLTDCDAALLLTQKHLAARLPLGIATLYADESADLDNNALEYAVSAKHDAPTSALQAAYLIYTSGSTGKPKGVMVSHANAVASTAARFQTYPEPPESFLLLSSFAFDSSIAGIFWTLSHGGRLLIAPEGQHKDPKSLATLIERERPSHLLCLPPLYALLLDGAQTEQMDKLRCVIVAGEACPPSLVGRHYARLPHTQLYNEYGPTEGTVWSSVYAIQAKDGLTDQPVPIGRPIVGSQFFILDARLNLSPIGVPGEIYLGGNGIARAYLQRPDLSAEKFVPNPFDEAGLRLYRTGDLARRRADGNIEFLGRVDNQVKIRGFRIELGEIEARLLRHPQVKETAVIVRADLPGDKRIVAYIVPTNEKEPENLRAFLKQTLPDYMIPTAFVSMERLPLMLNGKLDRNALPSPHIEEQFAKHYVAPQTPFEKQLTEIWAQLLGIERLGIHDNFFDLGGHSLSATQVIVRIRTGLGIDISVAELFNAPTVFELAQVLMRQQTDLIDDELSALLSELEQLPDHEAERLLLDLAA